METLAKPLTGGIKHERNINECKKSYSFLNLHIFLKAVNSTVLQEILCKQTKEAATGSQLLQMLLKSGGKLLKCLYLGGILGFTWLRPNFGFLSGKKHPKIQGAGNDSGCQNVPPHTTPASIFFLFLKRWFNQVWSHPLIQLWQVLVPCQSAGRSGGESCAILSGEQTREGGER